ncbi:MAG: penicillin-binding protein 1C, partial [Leptolyngbya sp. SIO4C5]|nr:penicillin-binding protein 1C [Leptolyngbya sp. SIO4C5]
ILSPRPDDYFVLPAAESAQRLALKIAAPADQPVTWTLNGQPLETTETNTLFWPMQVGTWTLEVASGQKRDRVQFQVQLAEEQPPQRGFSLRSDRP